MSLKIVFNMNIQVHDLLFLTLFLPEGAIKNQ